MKEFQQTFNNDKKTLKEDILNINKNRTPIILILDELTDIGNIGLIFRIADALRIGKIYIYNYKQELNYKLLHRKSRASIQYVPFEYINDLNNIIELKKTHKLIVLDKTNKSITYNKTKYTKPICLIIGAEITGVSQKLINISDQSIHLPMLGINTSINVATATSVALYHIFSELKK